MKYLVNYLNHHYKKFSITKLELYESESAAIVTINLLILYSSSN